ncbi:hypothetical protein Tco_1333176 [Tanacetum coccineum]
MGKVEHDEGKVKQAEHDLDDVDLVDALDLENIIKKLEEDFSRLLKAKKEKEAKQNHKLLLLLQDWLQETNSYDRMSWCSRAHDDPNAPPPSALRKRKP